MLGLSHEINGKTVDPGKDLFKFMMKIYRLAADLRRLGDRSVAQLRKCVNIVAGLSADYEVECGMLENTDLGRAEI